jgi:hypothetical protein
VHENTEQKENKEVYRLMSHNNHTITYTMHLLFSIAKLPDLELNIQSKQLLGFLLLDIPPSGHPNIATLINL